MNGPQVSESLKQWGLFALGLTSLIVFRGVGVLYLLDLLILAATVIAVVAVARKPRSIARPARLLLALAAIWLLGAVVTDLVRGTPIGNLVRGWSRTGVFALTLFSLAAFSIRRPGRPMAFLGGLAAATCLQTWLFPGAFQSGQPWKFGYAAPLALLGVVAASLPVNGRPPSALRQVGFPLVLAFANLALNFRSLFVILVAASGVTALTHLAGRLFPGRRVVTPVTGAALVTALAIGAWGLGEAYGRLAAMGALGDAARAKYAIQTRGDLGLLLGGRSESLASVQAIRDSPILGHGSWAENRRYADDLVLALRRRGREPEGGLMTSALIPSHSYIFGAWVEAGLAGAVFWATSWGLSLAALIRLVDLRSRWTPFLAFCGAQLLWSIPFSPFGADVRFTAAAQLAAVCLVLEASPKPGPASVGPRPATPPRRSG